MVEGVEALDLSLGFLRDLCDLLIEGAQRSARLLAEGRSVARGTAPAWTSLVSDIRVSRYEAGSLDLGLEMNRLVDVAPEIFSQQPLFPVITSPDATALDLFLDAAEDAASGRRDSDRLDAGVLDVLARSGALVARGATRLRVARARRAPIVVDAATSHEFRALAAELPASRVARVRGVLDSLTVSTKTLVLRLEDGRLLRGFAGAAVFETLKGLLGSDCLLEGMVSFRPNGDALRIEVDSAGLASASDVLWTKLPRVEGASPRARAAAPSGTGLDALFGKWPGDETDEELASALRDLS